VIFAHDTTGALVLAADLVNTRQRGEDTLTDVAALEEFLDEHHLRHQVAAGRAATRADLDAVLNLRERLRGAWEAAAARADTRTDVRSAAREDVSQVASSANQLLRDSGARPWLSDHDGWDWHLHVTEPTAPPDHRIAAQAGFALADLVRLKETSRLRICDAAECEAVLVDLSKNRSRRYCDTGNCGNREHVAAYRARIAARRAALIPNSTDLRYFVLAVL
jgi:predicted RNA-binding Zn ribbon-like protein